MAKKNKHEVTIVDEVRDDYEFSRATYYDLIEKGRESLDLMMEVARESEHPRAFEVLSTMISGISNVNDKLMDLNKKKKDLVTNKDDTKQIGDTTNNNIFIGSTTELQRFLHSDDSKQQDENVIDVEPEK
jgi:hypothetical protein